MIEHEPLCNDGLWPYYGYNFFENRYNCYPGLPTRHIRPQRRYGPVGHTKRDRSKNKIAKQSRKVNRGKK